MDNEIGKVIKLYRTAKGMSQAKLGQLIGVSRRNVSYYESGERIPPADVLKKLASIFNISLDVLVGTRKMNDESNSCYDYFYEEGIVNWRIENIAKERGLSYEQILELTEIPKERFDAIWFGNAQPYAEELVRLKKVLDVSIDYMLDETSKEKITVSEDLVLKYYNLYPDEVLELLESFCSLDKKQRTIVKAKSFELEEQKSVAADTQPLRKASGK